MHRPSTSDSLRGIWPLFLCLTAVASVYAYQLYTLNVLSYQTPVLTKYLYTDSTFDEMTSLAVRAAAQPTMWISSSTGYHREWASLFSLQYILASIGLVLTLVGGWLWMFWLFLNEVGRWFVGKQRRFGAGRHHVMNSIPLRSEASLDLITVDSQDDFDPIDVQKSTQMVENAVAEASDLSDSSDHHETGTLPRSVTTGEESSMSATKNSSPTSGKKVKSKRVSKEEDESELDAPANVGNRKAQNAKFWLWVFMTFSWLHILIYIMLIVGTYVHIQSLSALSLAIQYPAATTASFTLTINEKISGTIADPTKIAADEATATAKAISLLQDRASLGDVLNNTLYPMVTVQICMAIVLLFIQNWTWYRLGNVSESHGHGKSA